GQCEDRRADQSLFLRRGAPGRDANRDESSWRDWQRESEVALSAKAGAVIAGKSVDLAGCQFCRDDSHPRIDVVAALTRSIHPQLLRQVITALLGQDRRFDGAARSGPVAGRARRDVPIGIAELD